MKVASLSKAKNSLSRYVALARRGERVRILVRGVPAADLVPADTSSDGDGELAELERKGLLRRGKGGVAPEIERPGPKVRGDAVGAFLRARRDDR
jgi:prevent-host-death family protein